MKISTPRKGLKSNIEKLPDQIRVQINKALQSRSSKRKMAYTATRIIGKPIEKDQLITFKNFDEIHEKVRKYDNNFYSNLMSYEETNEDNFNFFKNYENSKKVELINKKDYTHKISLKKNYTPNRSFLNIPKLNDYEGLTSRFKKEGILHKTNNYNIEKILNAKEYQKYTKIKSKLISLRKKAEKPTNTQRETKTFNLDGNTKLEEFNLVSSERGSYRHLNSAVRSSSPHKVTMFSSYQSKKPVNQPQENHDSRTDISTTKAQTTTEESNRQTGKPTFRNVMSKYGKHINLLSKWQVKKTQKTDKDSDYEELLRQTVNPNLSSEETVDLRKKLKNHILDKLYKNVQINNVNSKKDELIRFFRSYTKREDINHHDLK